MLLICIYKEKVALGTKYSCVACEITLTQYFMECCSNYILLILYGVNWFYGLEVIMLKKM